MKLICKASQMEELMEKLLQTFHKEQLVMAKPGPGIQILED